MRANCKFHGPNKEGLREGKKATSQQAAGPRSEPLGSDYKLATSSEGKRPRRAIKELSSPSPPFLSPALFAPPPIHPSIAAAAISSSPPLEAGSR